MVIANGTATIGGNGNQIWGTLDAAVATGSGLANISGGVDTSATRDTFVPIVMPLATTFSAGGVNQTVPNTDQLTLAPGTYGWLKTSSQNQSVTLSSGAYYFDLIDTAGNFTLNIDLTLASLSTSTLSATWISARTTRSWSRVRGWAAATRRLIRRRSWPR